MQNSEDPTFRGFWCKSATVYFVYSFSLTYSLNPDESDNSFVSFVVDFEMANDSINKATVEGSEPELIVGEGIPDFRRGISPHIEFTPDCSYINYADESAYLYATEEECNRGREVRKRTLNGDDTGKRVEVGKLIRLFRTAGTCTIRITFLPDQGDQIYTEDILRILALVGRLQPCNKENRTQHSWLLMGKVFKKTRIYQIFDETVNDLCQRTDGKLEWLSKRVGIIAKKEPEPQTPFVVTVAEVDEEIAEVFCSEGEPEAMFPARSKMLAIRKYERYLAPILYRTLGTEKSDSWLKLEPAYRRPPVPNEIPGLFNQIIDSRLYGHFTRRSILLLCRDRKIHPTSFLLPDILNICEMVRSCWHMLTMMNRMIDDTLMKKRKNLLEQMKQKNVKADRESNVEELMRLRYWLTTSYEDPGMYLIAGDATSKLYDHMQQAFRINELRENVQGKLSLVDRLWKDVEEYAWLSSRERLERLR